MTQDTHKWKDLEEKIHAEEKIAPEGLPPQAIKTPEEITQLENELDQTKLLAQNHHNNYLRAMAEMENLKRRAAKDVEGAHKYALERMVRELLPGIDSLEKSLEHATDENLKQGVQMTLDLFLNALQKFHVTVLNPLHQPFNPTHHEAVSTLPTREHPSNTVLQVLQKGYLLHDRLVRPALVLVSKAE